jgi:4'-phosphopantetheinyl transferase
MIWKNVNNFASIDIGDDLLVIYGTYSLSDTLPFPEILTQDELVNSERIRDERQKSTWLSCRASLRLLLASFLNKNPLDIEFRKGRFGKLYLAGSDLYFNVSHSKQAFLLGFCFGGRIGIDIEQLNGTEDLPALVNYTFSKTESLYCKNGESAELFTEVWTLKEAFLKAVGVGLIDELPSISVVGDSKNDINRFKLSQKSFSCPNRETGSVVYRCSKPLKFIWLS